MQFHVSLLVRKLSSLDVGVKGIRDEKDVINVRRLSTEDLEEVGRERNDNLKHV